VTSTRPASDVALRLAAIVVAAAGAALVALLSAFLVPLRIGTTHLPLCFLVVIAGNIVVVRFAYSATGSRLAIVAPCLAWFVTMLPLTVRKTEGDLVVADSWVGLGVLFLGAMALAIAAFLVIVSAGPPVPGPASSTIDKASDDPETVTGESRRGTM
jgi:hypothetical protein